MLSQPQRKAHLKRERRGGKMQCKTSELKDHIQTKHKLGKKTQKIKNNKVILL